MLLKFIEQISSYFHAIIFNYFHSSISFNNVLIKAVVTSCLYVIYRYATFITTTTSRTRNEHAANAVHSEKHIKETTPQGIIIGALFILLSSTKFLVLYFLIGLVVVVWKLMDRGLGITFNNVIKAFNLSRTWKDSVEGTYNMCFKYFFSPVIAYLMVSMLSLIFSSVFEVTEGYRIFHIPRHYVYSSKQSQYVLGSVEIVSDMTFMIGSILFVKQYIQSLLKHSYREHEEDNVMGWNVFQHHADGSVTFTIPTEQSQSMANIVDDKWLHEMVSEMLTEPPA